MRINAFAFLVLAGTGLLVLGCGEDSGGAGGGSSCPTGQIPCDGVCIPEIDPVLEGAQGIQENIFSGPGPIGSCTASACHNAQNREEMLELTSAVVSRANLIDVEAVQVSKPRVEPNNVENSYILNKLLDVDIAPGTQQMPFGGIPLCDAKIEAVTEWIAIGAP